MHVFFFAVVRYKMENGEAFVEMPSIKWVRLCTYDTLSLSAILMILFCILMPNDVDIGYVSMVLDKQNLML